tara:strand:- start:25 stop:1020 length:996 start_codon:yes stop_codon:yes gene_type:complete
LQKVIELTEKLDNATLKVFKHFEESLKKEAQKLEEVHQIPELVNTKKAEYNNTAELRKVKRKFGEIFYGVLCPINGVNTKNRRYPDGTSTLDKDNYRDVEGPCVWKKIGHMTKWSTKCNWYSPQQVFEKLKQKHIDLISNGTVNRKNQKQMAQDLYDSRCYMNERMTKINEFSEKCELSKTYNVELVVVKKKDIFKQDNDDEYADNHIPGLPIDIVKAKIDSVAINGDELKLYPQLDNAVKTHLKDKHGIETNYQFNNGVALNIVDLSSYPPRGEFRWDCPFYFMDIAQLFKDPKLSNHCGLALQMKIEILEKLEEVNTKYAPQLLANGIF